MIPRETKKRQKLIKDLAFFAKQSTNQWLYGDAGRYYYVNESAIREVLELIDHYGKENGKRVRS